MSHESTDARRGTPTRVARRAVAGALAAAALLSACTAAQVPEDTPASRRATTTPGPARGGGAATATPAADPTRSCATRLVQDLDLRERVGQLVMVGVTQAGLPAARQAVGRSAAGGVFFLGGWYGQDAVRRTTRTLQSDATRATPGVGLLVAADQEGGAILQLRGDGFSRPPSAVQQGSMAPDAVRALSTGVGREMAGAGVNLDLAPVADTVDPALGRDNAPIGHWDRQFGDDPARVSPAVSAAVTGLHAGGVGATVKHFPGLGRVRSNTDLSATGIDDDRTTADDPVLRPFADGIAAGADVVMVSTARYPRIDPDAQAAFSRPVVTGLLRQRLGYGGVVATDDLGVAASVAAIPTGERAVRSVLAGVDVSLTGRPGDAALMTRALRERAQADPAFAAQVQAAAERVVALKVRRGLVACAPAQP